MIPDFMCPEKKTSGYSGEPVCFVKGIGQSRWWLAFEKRLPLSPQCLVAYIDGLFSGLKSTLGPVFGSPYFVYWIG